jgi:bifunctional enzyme CysN/CysC
MKEQMNIVIVGHVDHGKSTIIGRLLADTDSLPKGKLDNIKQYCEKNSKPFEYAFLLDALKDEQSQGITIDSARVFFKTRKRNYIIIDAPGHIEFLKNMVSGAARAEASILVIDALEGIQENSRRHGYMLSMLGIKQIAVLINKLDLVDYDQKVFQNIKVEYLSFLKEIELEPRYVIPVSGRNGDNLAKSSKIMNWYDGPTLLEALDKFEKEKPQENKPFRMYVQDVYKFTQNGDQRRIVAGTVESGTVDSGSEIVFYPSGKKSRINKFEKFNAAIPSRLTTGESIGFTLKEQIYIQRGELATIASEQKPLFSKKIKVNLFWLGRNPLVKEKDYILKLGTFKAVARLEEIHRIIDASDLSTISNNGKIDKNDIAECVFSLNKTIAFDKTEDISGTSRFVLVDNYEIVGGGIIRDAVQDDFTWLREKIAQRNYKWEKSGISFEERAEKYNQKSVALIITGPKGSGKKEVAKELEVELFNEGKRVYFLGIGNVLYGLDADIKGNNNHREEHLRRLSEIANLFIDAGLILIITAINLSDRDLEIFKTSIIDEKIKVVWSNDNPPYDISYDIKIPGIINIKDSVMKIKNFLLENGIIFKPW